MQGPILWSLALGSQILGKGARGVSHRQPVHSYLAKRLVEMIAGFSIKPVVQIPAWNQQVEVAMLPHQNPSEDWTIRFTPAKLDYCCIPGLRDGGNSNSASLQDQPLAADIKLQQQTLIENQTVQALAHACQT